MSLTLSNGEFEYNEIGLLDVTKWRPSIKNGRIDGFQSCDETALSVHETKAGYCSSFAQKWDVFSLLFCIPTWPLCRQMKTIYSCRRAGRRIPAQIFKIFFKV